MLDNFLAHHLMGVRAILDSRSAEIEAVTTQTIVFLALPDQHRPDLLQNPKLHPALEGPVNGAVVPQFPGQAVPVTAVRTRNMMPSKIRLG